MRTEFGGGIPPVLGGSPVAVPAIPNLRMAGRAVAKVVHRCQDANENQNLDLSECQLMQMPDGVYHLMRNTVVLTCNLSYNVIQKIPAKFTIKFSNITELNLSNNQLNSLPEELEDLRELQRLDISSNHYHALPKVVFRLRPLKIFNAAKNYIAEVDVERLTTLPDLQEVNFENNPLCKSTYDQFQHLGRIRVHLSAFQPEDFEDLMDLDEEGQA
uniref:LR20 n=1 Tax=Hemiscolopendra marginata TaxID=943146 RepID=A0A646QFH3_9MYRI